MGNYELLYPDDEIQIGELSAAIYGPQGIKTGHPSNEVVAMLAHACRNLAAKGAELIVPGFTEIPVVLDELCTRIEAPVIDCNLVYAEYAMACRREYSPSKRSRLRIVGGVGPAATVDSISKIIRHTKAIRDQDHLPIIVEHKPQIPDRTVYLVSGELDPTVALYSACKKLEENGASAIAIPCNTGHAFVERIQHFFSIPILNMLRQTVDHIAHHHLIGYNFCLPITIKKEYN